MPALRRLAPLGALALALSVCSPASGHDVLFQRLVHVRVGLSAIDVAMAVTIHAGPEALTLREQFDRDGDELLSRDEQDALANWLDAESFRDFALGIDGDPVGIDGRERSLELTANHRADLGEGLVFRTVRRGALVLRPGPRTLTLVEAPGNPRERIAIRVDLHPGLTLVTSAGEGGATKVVPVMSGSWQALVAGEAGRLVIELTGSPSP